MCRPIGPPRRDFDRCARRRGSVDDVRMGSRRTPKAQAARNTFDLAYYDRFYVDPKTRVDDEAHHAQLATFVVTLIEWSGVEIERVLDVGAGVGRWGAWLRRNRPSVEVVSTELDEEVCKRFGHERRDISSWRDRRRYDLVICQGVLPYLDDDAAERALENLAAMCRGFLYLEAITAKDLDEVCDRSRTDLRVHARKGSWYRARLRRHFVEVGAGLFYVKDGDVAFFELEVR
jgi:hypothetical protein